MSEYSYEETKEAQRHHHDFPNTDSAEYEYKRKIQEKEYLDKLVNDHWNYVAGVMDVSGAVKCDMELAEFHYKTAAKHFWGHAREYHVGDTL